MDRRDVLKLVPTIVVGTVLPAYASEAPLTQQELALLQIGTPGNPTEWIDDSPIAVAVARSLFQRGYLMFNPGAQGQNANGELYEIYIRTPKGDKALAANGRRPA